MKKEETVITLANGGMHSQTNYRKCKNMIRDNKYAMARLYHLVFTGSDNESFYLYAINALAKKLRDNKIPCQWKACFEYDDEKRLHLHVMLILEAKHGRPDYWIRYADDGWLTMMLKQRGMEFNISRPRNKIHRTATGKKQNYAYITKTGPKLEDALIWCSYLYKVRSKDDSMKTIYHSSRERASKNTLTFLPSAPKADKETFSPSSLKVSNDVQKHSSLSTNEKESQNENCTTAQHGTKQEGEAGTSSPADRYSLRTVKAIVCPRPSSSSPEAGSSPGKACSIRYGSGASTHHRKEGASLKLTPAQSYLASLYEHCVDNQKDVDAIRLYLLERGVKKSPGMVADELENVFGFLGYASSHAAPAKPDIAMLDALIDRTPLRAVLGSC